MPRRKPKLCIDDYDCIGFDLDHTLCRYNVGNLARLVYELLADYLVSKKGYDSAIKNHRYLSHHCISEHFCQNALLNTPKVEVKASVVPRDFN